MKYVKVDWDTEHHGFRVDAQEYLAALPTLRGALPDGAWAFASDAGHYAFASDRCVKDLELTNISLPTRTANGQEAASGPETGNGQGTASGPETGNGQGTASGPETGNGQGTASGPGAASLTFRPNRWKHATGLRIEYEGVTRFSIDYARSIDWMESITVLLDEVLPHEGGAGGGITHEIALTDATITVHCADLRATWEETAAD